MARIIKADNDQAGYVSFGKVANLKSSTPFSAFCAAPGLGLTLGEAITIPEGKKNAPTAAVLVCGTRANCLLYASTAAKEYYTQCVSANEGSGTNTVSFDPNADYELEFLVGGGISLTLATSGSRKAKQAR